LCFFDIRTDTRNVKFLQGIPNVELEIISGGQTGVDRGALDAALEAGIAHGGFCPLGRRAEDGVIPSRYALTEASTEAYPARTAMNVRRGHGTLLLVHGTVGLSHSAGTKLTLEMCRRQKKAWHAADPRRPDHADRVARWIEELAGALEVPDGWLEGLDRERKLVVNVAGPRESRAPGIHDETVDFLRMVLGRLREITTHVQLSSELS
jgi:hypothetical protein